MPRRTRPASEPDLFSIETVPRAQTPEATLTPPTVAEVTSMRPSDFGRVIASWSDVQVEQLHRIVTEEVRRRNLASAKPDQKGDAIAGRSVRQRKPDTLAKLTPGQVSAIRAANGAGVKLGAIARQFGLPLATVKRVIGDVTES